MKDLATTEYLDQVGIYVKIKEMNFGEECIHFIADIEFEGVSSNAITIGKKMIFKWVRSTRNNVIVVDSEGEAIHLTFAEYLMSDNFTNNEAVQSDLIRFTLTEMKNENN